MSTKEEKNCFLPTVHVNDGWISGEQGSTIVKKECRNIDECEYGLDDCGGSSRCVDTDGSYECDCNYDNEWKYLRPNSYNETTRTCQKYDDCASSPCDQVCTNTDSDIWPFYECSCLPGYLMEKTSENYDFHWCRIDETLPKICDSDGRECQYKCVDDNLNGSKCLCPHGYTEVNGTCEDINECDYEFLDRDPGEICVNLHGSYQLFIMFDEENSLCLPDYRLSNYRQFDSSDFSCDLLTDECPTDLPDCPDRASYFTKELLNFTSPHEQFVGEIAPLASEGDSLEHSFDIYKNKDAPAEYLENIDNFFIHRRNDTFAELYFNGTIPESDSNMWRYGATVIYTAKGQNDSDVIRKEAFLYFIFTSKYDF
ncbi:Oidioi.mRNA.OKI2018_I69.chr2.g4181.t1.cds [Oikopleura dioica]|uniref:Oidioi.mRNA.OKI2018_I69.chr2.g4181.t1.cds n=1 Tax=Oikopleura dioica TaxID=34765 RepID=A0ABN7T0Q5_OIKDI|nr:Oidioi.mRNA.OKI2018_I69.chr2.g4181.t1.cds [Oikopleura dioica]